MKELPESVRQQVRSIMPIIMDSGFSYEEKEGFILKAIGSALVECKVSEMLEMLKEISDSIHFLNSNNMHVTKDKIDRIIQDATTI